MKLSERPPPFLLIFSGGLRHDGLKCACSFDGTAQPHSQGPAGDHQQTKERKKTGSKRGMQSGGPKTSTYCLLHCKDVQQTPPAGTLPKCVKQFPTDTDCISSPDTAKSRQWFLLSLKLCKIHSKSFLGFVLVCFSVFFFLTIVKNQILPYVLDFQFICWHGEYLWARFLFP